MGTPADLYYLNFCNEINEKSCNALMAACTHIVSQKLANGIYLMFSSSGGSVDHGIALYNFLRALPLRLVFHNIGSVQSIATVIFHAADERFGVHQGTFMFHGIAWNIQSPTTLTHTQVEEIKSGFVQAEKRLAEIICGRCKLTEAEIRALFIKGDTKDSVFALEKGIISDVREIKVPADVPFATITA